MQTRDYYHFLGSWSTTTFISMACTWAYMKDYDEEDEGLAAAAAILTSIAFTGATFGICAKCCSCFPGVSETAKAIEVLGDVRKATEGEDSELCTCIYITTVVLFGLIFALSVGPLQLISAALMTKSVVVNTAVNVKVFGAFIVALDVMATFTGFCFGCFLCIVCAKGDKIQ